MKVLVIGQGGREHALVWKIRQSPRVEKIFCAPGNAGIAQDAETVPIPSNDIEKLIRFAKDRAIDLTLVGPEAPLVQGIVDRFRIEKLKIFGPDRFGSQLEGSKVFAKNLMKQLRIPTAEFKDFDRPESAMDYIAIRSFPIVVKVDGLAGGKGVSVVPSKPKAVEAIHLAMIKKVFGKAGERIIIEDYLEGVEASLIAVTDGQTVLMLAPSQDHKRIYDGDQGPNTGGMGAYSPAPFITQEIQKEALERIFLPVVREMKSQGTPYVGFIYAGVMLTESGIKVLEFNVRMGDPEAQVILPRLEGDLFELCLACCEGRLSPSLLKWKDEDTVCVVLAAEGYPGDYKKGARISGLAAAEALPHVLLFHAGTEKHGDLWIASGGRVMNVVASGHGIFQALSRAYEAVGCIYFPGMQYRKDIGHWAFQSR